MGSLVPKAGDTQADATLTKLQCQGRCERWCAAPGPQQLFGGARLNQWQKKKRIRQLFAVSGGGGLASGSIRQQHAFACADMWYAGY